MKRREKGLYITDKGLEDYKGRIIFPSDGKIEERYKMKKCPTCGHTEYRLLRPKKQTEK